MRGLSRAPLGFKGPVNPLLAIGIVAIGVVLVVKSYRTWIAQQICLLMAIIKKPIVLRDSLSKTIQLAKLPVIARV